MIYSVILLEEDENEEYTRPKSLILDDLELIPSQYEESRDLDDRLTIRARVVLSKEQYLRLGKLLGIVKVVRHDIDIEPRKMKLSEIAWSGS